MSGHKLIQPKERMSQLSVLYVQTIASHLGYGADIPKVDHDSIDLTISSSSGRKAKIDLQLKSTTTIDINALNAHHFSFPLPINNYNDLKTETICPRILVVLCMPINQEEWIEHSLEQLLIRKCAYWVSLQGEPETNNKESISIKIPIKNVFSPAALSKIMEQVDSGEFIKND